MGAEMSNTKLVWATPGGDDLVAYMARASNPANQNNTATAPKLIKHLLDECHWSPLEMVSACVEINTWRDIGRQILRHRSFSFQEFSQRYADVSVLPDLGYRECRTQDTKNRQNSIISDDDELNEWFGMVQDELLNDIQNTYKVALSRGVAKEVARTLLPEGLTPSRMYMSGTLRSWVHYLKVRSGNGTQKEHMEIAKQITEILRLEFPKVLEAAGL